MLLDIAGEPSDSQGTTYQWTHGARLEWLRGQLDQLFDSRSGRMPRLNHKWERLYLCMRL